MAEAVAKARRLESVRPDTPLGVLDIGSNSIRLVAYSGVARTPVPIYNERAFCQLGASVAKTGKIEGAPADLALDSLRRFQAIATRLRIDTLTAFATAAMRDATNRDAFLAEAEKALGQSIRVLSGAEEARYSALGVMMSFPQAEGVMADLGGGSLELARISRGKIVDWATLPIGVLVLRQKQSEGVDVKAVLDEVLGGLGWLTDRATPALYIVGGTWRALARLHMVRRNYMLDVLHHYEIDVADCRSFTKRLALIDGASLDGLHSISSQRREALPLASLVLHRLLKILRPSQSFVSAFGVREGALSALMNPEDLQQDPLLVACEAMGARLGKSPDYGAELIDWTARLFHSEAAASEVERYRKAACLVSDIAWDCHPNNRAQMIANAILRAPFSGIDHAGRIFMAHSLAHRHEISNMAHILEGAVMPLRHEPLSRALGLAFRLAHSLSASLPALLPETKLHRAKRVLRLEIPKRHSALVAPIIDKRLRLTADALGIDYELCVL